MFAKLFSNVTQIVRNSVRALGVAIQRSPWIAAAAVVAFFLVL